MPQWFNNMDSKEWTHQEEWEQIQRQLQALSLGDKIIKIWIDPLVGIKTFQLRKLAFGLKLEGAAFKEAVDTFRKMYKC